MKKIFLFSIITAIFLGFSFDVDAQYRGKKKKKKKKDKTKSEYFDESGSITSKLWYGADVSINLRRSNIGGNYEGNIFVGGLSPMVGYKISDNFSVGPKVGILYQGGKFNDGSAAEDLRLSATDFSVGVFSRLKVFEYYFIHGEIENVWESFATGVIDSDNKLELEREPNAHYYLGAGYQSGGDISFSAYVLWDFSREFSSNSVPIVTRFGLTYRF